LKGHVEKTFLKWGRRTKRFEKPWLILCVMMLVMCNIAFAGTDVASKILLF